MRFSLFSNFSKAVYCSLLFIFVCAFFAANSEVSAQRVRLRSKITPPCTPVAGAGRANFADLYADGNLAVLGTYFCRGAFIFDVSNPDAPVLKAHYNPNGDQQFLEAIVVGTRGYFGSGNNGGVHIVDLSDPANPRLLGIVNSTKGNGFNSIHEMVVHGNFLIENFNGFSNKIIKVINISDPANPVFVRDIVPTETLWVHGMHVRGNRMFTSGWGNTSVPGRTEIYDITNLATQAPTLLGFIEDRTTTTNGNNMHSSWSSEDGKYLYSCRETADGKGDVRTYDISNPAQPVLVDRITMTDLGLNAVTPHNPVVKGNRLYVSWYQAGVQIFDLTNPAKPKRIGQYDTYQDAFAPEETPKSLALEPWDLVCGAKNLQNALPTSYDGNWSVFPFLGEDKVLASDLVLGLYVLDTTSINKPKNQISDFDGDGKTDFSLFTPQTGVWRVENSANNLTENAQFGQSEDKIIAGDYDGDGKSDYAVFRPSNGYWFISGSATGFRAVQFGFGTDVPVPADYDADGKTDIAVWRPSNGYWYVMQSSLGFRSAQWGMAGDKVFGGDYDADGKADFAVYRGGYWYVLQSSSSQILSIQFGATTDKPLSGDFDGDGKNDYAVYRPSEGNWYILRSANNQFSATQFGAPDDLPIPADYDGDGKTDISVFRPNNNTWYRLNSSSGAFAMKNFGQSGDKPSPVSAQAQ